jgi:diacylglycerol kinase family enzyme
MERLSRYGWEAAEPARRPVLLVNPRSGDGRAAEAGLVERARERGIDTLVLGPHDDLAALVDEAVADGAEALGMAGGDGSLGVVAAAARAHGLPFVCVPAGTRNHFAVDLGVDRHDLVGALDAFGDHGVERSIDVAEVNGRVYLNNVSLGIYGEAVQQAGYRDAKVRTLLETTAEVIGPSQAAPDVGLVDDLGHEHRHPAVVLVSNNPYALDRPVAPGTRPRLDGGELGVVVLGRPRAGADPPARVWTATHLAVDATAPVHAGVDGEAVELDAPLSLVIRPGALRVRISSRHPGVSPSGGLP